MGTCCSAHLVAKVREYAPNAQNGAVTVTILENPRINIEEAKKIEIVGVSMTIPRCDYCNALAEFSVSYYSK